MIINPPHTNGIMELTDLEKATIKAKIQVIIDGFIPNDYQETADTFYIVSKYNSENPDLVINGDSAEYLLSAEEGE